MFDAKANSAPQARLQGTMIQQRLLRAELRPGRRWNWYGKRGWWVCCSLLNEQESTWRIRRFVATLAEASAFVDIHEADWIWQDVTPKPAWDKSSQQQAYVPFLMF